jgi:hypothetical protein
MEPSPVGTASVIDQVRLDDDRVRNIRAIGADRALRRTFAPILI